MIDVNRLHLKRTGDVKQDIELIFDYLYQLEREMKYELQKPQKTVKLSYDAVVHRFDDGIWIGTKKTEKEFKSEDNGIYIEFGIGVYSVVNGNAVML